MGIKERQQEYLAKAKEAEEMAGRAQDETTKSAWRRIAAGYRELAARQEQKH
jgi:hypothetical protein